MAETASESSIGEVREVDPAKKKIKHLIGIDPGPHLGLVVLRKDVELGWVVVLRWTFELPDAPKGDVHCHWARECAKLVRDPHLGRWFELADAVVLERQYVQGQPLPSYLIMVALCAAVETLWPAKAKLVGSNEVKAAYFTEAQRKNYAKRKQVAELMTKTALARATTWDPSHRVHDQADAFLIGCYYIDYVLKRGPEKLSVGYRRPKIADAPKQREEDPDYKPRRGRPRK
jgi:hypothetical protein